MNTPVHQTPNGSPILSCELDETCPVIDCTKVFEELDDTMTATPEGAAMMAHLCGVEFPSDWHDLDDAA